MTDLPRRARSSAETGTLDAGTRRNDVRRFANRTQGVTIGGRGLNSLIAGAIMTRYV